MPISPWPVDRDTQMQQLTEQVTALAAHNEHLQESISDLEMDDRGWTRITSLVENEISPTNRHRMVESCRMLAVANPLLKGGLLKRIGYIWGQGVEINARIPPTDADAEVRPGAADDATAGTGAGARPGKKNNDLQDAINQVIDRFEKLNETSLMGMDARENKERALGTDGEVFLALFTDTRAGEVRVRAVPQLEIQQIVTNPEDREEPWFYYREYTLTRLPSADVENLSMQPTQAQVQRVLYPALGFDPKTAGYGFRPAAINGIQVMWDAPMVHLAVNRLDGWQRGIPDVYASLAWARLYQEFLIDWAGLTKALSKIAWKASGDTKQRAANAAAKVRVAGNNRTGNDAGATAVAGPGTNLEAMSKSGATIDSQSGKPLAAMIAAGLGLPVTMLLADPGVTGARATAETLDIPTILEMGMRRLLWQSLLERIIHYVIEVAANAPSGAALRGVVPVLDFAWPPLDAHDPVQLVAAIVNADSTDKMPPLTTVRLLLSALGVPDVDEVLAEVTDPKTGEFVPPKATMQSNAGQVAADAFRRGQDAAEALR